MVHESEREIAELKGKALKTYSFATHKAEKSLLTANPVRLSVALNYGVFQAECQGEKDTAILTCQRAIDLALKKIDTLEDEREQ